LSISVTGYSLVAQNALAEKRATPEVFSLYNRY